MRGPTVEQLEMRELVERLAKEEQTLTAEQARTLEPFVQIVRFEIVETDATPTRGRSARRTNYYMLNELGLKMRHQWTLGNLDKFVVD